jgi:succinyl-CoA synthetase alpha subunit
MSVDLGLSPDASVILEGIDREDSRRWAQAMQRYGTKIAGWVASTATEADGDGLPVFPSHAEALAASRAKVCVSMVEPRRAADAIIAAADAGFRLIVSLTADVPLHDAIRMRRRLRDLGAMLVGPGSSGIARPAARVKLGAVPEHCLAPGAIALVSASASLASEAGYQMAQAGLGQSLFFDAGSHTVKGTPMADLPALLEADTATAAVAFLGTARGTAEEEFAAAMQRAGLRKKVFAYIAGASLPDGALGGFWPPPGRPGPIPAAAKRAALEAAGAEVYNSLGSLITALRSVA